MAEVSRAVQVQACYKSEILCCCELYNLVSFASGKKPKSKRDRVRTTKTLLSMLPELHVNRANSIALLDKIGELFIGNAPVSLCGRHAPSWHSWVVGTAGDVLLAALNMLNIPYQLSGDQIAISGVPTPNPETVDLALLSHEILHSGGVPDCPALTPSALRYLDASLQVELINAERKMEPPPPVILDPRGQFAYQEAVKGTAWKTIKAQINNRPEWETLETDNGVKDLAKRYAAKNHLPGPTSRRAGRRPKNTK
jgi:hypothetical protein